jgi:heat shock protein HslJ
MKKKLFICGLSALMMGMVSCKSQQKDTKNAGEASVAFSGNSQNALNWDGFYSGFLPCADCMGIQVSLELSKDQTFHLKMVYAGKDAGSFESSGKITRNKAGNCITIGDGEDKMQFLVGENVLTALDREGNKITGELAENYVLVKVDLNLVEKYWKLTELFGEPVVASEGSEEAHILLKKEDCRVNGSGGCNSIGGTYLLKPDNGIVFSQMVSTLKMCLHMDTETNLKKALETADRYALNGDVLILRAGANSLARFEAVCRE